MPKHAIEIIVNETISNTSVNNSEMFLDVYYGTSIQDFLHNLWQGLFPAIGLIVVVSLVVLWIVVFAYSSFKLLQYVFKSIKEWLKNRKQKGDDVNGLRGMSVKRSSDECCKTTKLTKDSNETNGGK